MSRPDLAYAMMIALGTLAIIGWLLTRRYTRYQRELRRGHRDAKRVWKPFWLS